jgi:hypothetical protein
MAGSVATLGYDATKFVLSQLDPSPYNPFHVVRVFGELLVGASAPALLVYSSGIAFHVLNGISFGIAFCLLFRNPGPLLGIGWGIFLELFQLALYPGWLHIRYYQEFAQISALSHLLYGIILGYLCRHGLSECSNPRTTA